MILENLLFSILKLLKKFKKIISQVRFGKPDSDKTPSFYFTGAPSHPEKLLSLSPYLSPVFLYTPIL